MKALDSEQLRNLLEQLKQGSEPAFNSLYMEYSKPLYKRVFMVIKDEDKTEEIIQDIFLKIWQTRQTINPDLSFKSLLYTIANNLAYDFLRKIARDKRLIACLLLNATDYYMHTEEVLMVNETERVLQEALNKLSPQQKLVFTLCKLEGKSYEEAGAQLGITTATVNSHIVKSSRYIRGYLVKNLELSIWLLLLCNLNIQ
jgi:RNA polymerase sigma factor (sigma-70 family)